jgi:hypothetical protein
MTSAPEASVRNDSLRVAAIAALTIAGWISMHSLMDRTAEPSPSGHHHESHGSYAALHGMAGVCLFLVGAVGLAVVGNLGRVRPIRRRLELRTRPSISADRSAGRVRLLELGVIRV